MGPWTSPFRQPVLKSVFAAFTAVILITSTAALSGGGALNGDPGDPGTLSHRKSNGQQYHAIPSDDPDDGKFLAVAGTGLSTIGGREIHLFVGVPKGRTTFELSIFDAETGGHWDREGGPGVNDRLVYSLHKDRLKVGSGGTLVAQWNSDSGFDDNCS